MLNKFRYKFKTRNYFHPERAVEVGEEDFLKILRGQVFNPHSKELDSQRYADYGYMVVGVSEKSPLNSWAGQNWGVNGYWNAHENAQWYGKFSCEHLSRIVVPGKIQVDFNPHSKLSFGKFYVENFSGEPWVGGGFMQCDKDIFTRTLVSDFSVEQVLALFKKVYGCDISRR